jgi:hypothetical protein
MASSGAPDAALVAPPASAAAAPDAVPREPAPAAAHDLAALPLDAALVELPRSAHLVYDTTGTGRLAGIPLTLHGITTTDWHFAGGRFDSSLVNDTADFGQTSSGRFLAEAGLAPERYTEKRRHRAPVATSLDWDDKQITFLDSGAVVPAASGIQDRLSVQFQMSVLRQAYPQRFVAGAQFSMTVAGLHDLSEWLVTVRGEETIDTPGGPVAAVRIQTSRPQEESNESMDMWLSAQLHWFPVRVRLVDRNGTVIDSVLHSATLE